MKKTTIAFLISSLFVIAACSPNDDAKAATTNTSAPATSTAETAPPAANTTETATPAEENNITTSSNLGSDVMATVNGQPISSSHAQLLIEMTEKASPGTKVDVEMLKDNIITQEILVQEARRLKLDQTDDYKIQAEFMSKAMLTNLLFQDYIKNNPITDEEINKEYEFIKQQLMQTQEAERHEFQARHILVDSEEKAKEIIGELEAGADFDALAKEHSMDPGSAQNGGSLGGWTPATVFVPEFAEALAQMNKGDTTKAPVQTQYGWHIIRVDDTREVDTPAEAMPELSAHIKEQLREQLSTRKILEYQEKLIQEANIVKSE